MRHSFASHLANGTDIAASNRCSGAAACLQTTMIYSHILEIERTVTSPLDRLLT